MENQTQEKEQEQNQEQEQDQNLEQTQEEVTEFSYKKVGAKKPAEQPRRKLVGVEDKKAETKRILIFLGITFGIGWFMAFTTMIPMYRSGDSDLMQEAISMIGTMMFTPAIAAVVARLITKEGLVHSGFQFNFSSHKFCFLFSWFGISALTFLGALLYFVVFRDNFDPQMTRYVADAKAMGSEMDDANISAAFKTTLLMNVFSAPVLDIINSFGEEWGFRGYLLPKLYRKFGTIPAMLISSFLGGLWYAPLVVIGIYYGGDYQGYPYTGIAAMCLFGMVTGCIFSFICLRTGSIFTAVFAHSALNVMMSQAAYFTKDGGNYFVGPSPTGIVAGIPFLITAVIFLVYMYKHPVKSSSEKELEEAAQSAE